MECRKALPTTLMARMFSPSTVSGWNDISRTLRFVGLPTADAAMQKLLKSCSPSRCWAPASMADTSKPPGTNHEKSFMKMGAVLSTHRW